MTGQTRLGEATIFGPDDGFMVVDRLAVPAICDWAIGMVQKTTH